jgi:hypothetical protein
VRRRGIADGSRRGRGGFVRDVGSGFIRNLEGGDGLRLGLRVSRTAGRSTLILTIILSFIAE